MRSLGSRLEKLEKRMVAAEPPLTIRRFMVHGNDPNMTASDFLRSQGHDMDDPRYFNIVRVILPEPDEGKMTFAPYRM